MGHLLLLVGHIRRAQKRTPLRRLNTSGLAFSVGLVANCRCPGKQEKKKPTAVASCGLHSFYRITSRFQCELYCHSHFTAIQGETKPGITVIGRETQHPLARHRGPSPWSNRRSTGTTHVGLRDVHRVIDESSSASDGKIT